MKHPRSNPTWLVGAVAAVLAGVICALVLIGGLGIGSSLEDVIVARAMK